MGLLALKILDLPSHKIPKLLVTALESEGGFADGVKVVTGYTIAHRSLRLADFSGRIHPERVHPRKMHQQLAACIRYAIRAELLHQRKETVAEDEPL
jgi:hypothetical protein